MSHSDFRMHDAVDEEQLTTYRPVSGLAVVTLLLGLLAAVAAFSTYFIWLPFLPILTGAIALRQIRRTNGQTVGTVAAVLGMALGGVFLGLQIGQLAHTHRMAYIEARRFADGWLKLLADGRWQAADQGTLARPKRTLSARSVTTAYEADPKLEKQWQEFVKASPVCQSLVQWGPDTKIRWLGNVQQRYLKEQRAVQLLYEITPPGKSPFEVKIWVIRDQPMFDNPATWWTKEVKRVE